MCSDMLLLRECVEMGNIVLSRKTSEDHFVKESSESFSFQPMLGSWAIRVYVFVAAKFLSGIDLE